MDETTQERAPTPFEREIDAVANFSVASVLAPRLPITANDCVFCCATTDGERPYCSFCTAGDA